MSKRRKKSKRKPAKTSGGAFGKKQSAVVTPFPDPPVLTLERGFEQEKARMLSAVQRALAERDFKSDEETRAFLASLARREMKGIIHELEGDRPPDAEQAALELLELDHLDTPDSIRRKARAALEIDPECVEAHVLMAETYTQWSRAEPMFRKAFAAARERWANLIDECRGNPDHGLWGYHETRPYLRGMHSYALRCCDRGEFDTARATLEEILELNANDNQACRCDLLHLLLHQGEIEEAGDLLDRYPNDFLVDMRFGLALVQFIQTMIRTRKQPDLPDGIDDPVANVDQLAAEYLDNLPSEYKAATRTLEEALDSNPFVGLFLCVELADEIDDEAEFIFIGGPDEALGYARESRSLWSEIDEVYLWFIGVAKRHSSSPAVRKAVKDKNHAPRWAELFAQLEQLEQRRPRSFAGQG